MNIDLVLLILIISILLQIISVIAGVTTVNKWLKSKKHTITVGKGDTKQQLKLIIEEMKKT